MKNLNHYENFLLERKFENIVNELFSLLESESRTFEWEFDTEPKTFEWEIINKPENKTIEKLRKFLEGLTKEKIKEYYIKLMNKLKFIKTSLRKPSIIAITSVFLAFCSLNYLIEPQSPSTTREEVLTIDNEIKREIVDLGDEIKSKVKTAANEVSKSVNLNFGSSFEEAQKHVRSAEAGYSDDRGDSGNWVKVPGFGQRFVGTNHGISAPILAEYLGRLPKKEDMMNLSYETAVKIYKKNYWEAQNLNLFTNQSLATLIYDGCVNQGIYAMRDVVRESMQDFGVEISDSENPFQSKWIKVANGLDPERLHKLIKKGRLSRYRRSETYSRHGKGWENRLAKLSFTDKDGDIT